MESRIQSVEGLRVSCAASDFWNTFVVYSDEKVAGWPALDNQSTTIPDIEDALQVQQVMAALQHDLKARKRATTAPSKQTPSTNMPNKNKQRLFLWQMHSHNFVAYCQAGKQQLRSMQCWELPTERRLCRQQVSAISGYDRAIFRDCHVLQKRATCSSSHHSSLYFKLLKIKKNRSE